MPDQTRPNDKADDSRIPNSADQHMLVPRPALEQLYSHLTGAYAIYRTRKLRQAILILEHILKLRP